MRILLVLILASGCASPQLRPTKIADQPSDAERYKNGRGYLDDGGPDLDFGAANAVAAVVVLAVAGGIIWAVAASGDDGRPEDRVDPELAPELESAAPPRWAQALPRQ